MKINDGNSVQGLYNANLTPSNVIFTYGDLVYYGTTLYTCKGETNVLPSVGNPDWEVYMGDKWRILNTIEDIDQADASYVNYIGPEGLSQFMKSRLGGLNSNGKVQLLDDSELIPLSSLTKNSVFQLSFNYLNTVEMEPLPFLAQPNNIYLVRTLSGIEPNDVFIQEIIEYPENGTYRSWVRSGIDLSLAVWSPTRGESFNDDYITALDKIVESYVISKAAYDSVVNNIHEGNYYSYELVNILIPRDILRFDEGSQVITGSEVKLTSSFHYKIYLRKVISGNNYESMSIDITPEDFLTAYMPLSKINYGDGIYLQKDPSSSIEDGWTLQVGNRKISRVLKSKNFIE